MFAALTGDEANLVLLLSEYSLKVVALLSIVLVTVWLLKKSSSSTRHFIFLAAVAVSLIIPLLSFCLPRYEAQILPGELSSVLLPEEATVSNALAHEISDDLSLAPKNYISTSSPIQELQSSGNIKNILVPQWLGLQEFLLIIWFSGVAFFTIRLAISSITVACFARRALPAGLETKLLLSKLKDRLKIRNRTTVLICNKIFSPFTTGIFRHIIILPAENISNSAVLESILLHELAHIKRFDNLAQRFAQTLCIIQWFNPLTWLISQMMMRERELACDDLVISMGTKASTYASNLINLARKIKSLRRSNWAAAALVNSNNFKERIMLILATNLNRNGTSGRFKLLVVALLAMLAVPMAILQNVTLADSEEPIINTTEEQVAPVIQQDKPGSLETGELFSLCVRTSKPDIVKITTTFLNKEVKFRKIRGHFFGVFPYPHSTKPGEYKVILELEDKDGNTFKDPGIIPVKKHDYKAASLSKQDHLAIQNILSSIEKGEKAPPFEETHLIPVKGKITSYFGKRKNPITGEIEWHNGLDIAAESGTPVHSSLDGKVVLAEDLGKYGKTVVLSHGGNMGTVYSHLKSWTVKKGQKVKRGEVIGKVGNSGVSTGPHLHWSLIINDVALRPHYRKK